MDVDPGGGVKDVGASQEWGRMARSRNGSR